MLDTAIGMAMARSFLRAEKDAEADRLIKIALGTANNPFAYYSATDGPTVATVREAAKGERG